MDKLTRLAAGIGALLMPVLAHAQTTVAPSASFTPLDYGTTAATTYASTYDPAAASAAAGAATAGFAVFGIMMMVIWLVGLLLYILAIFMFIDVAHREFPNPSTKTMWVVLMMLPFVNFFALLAYFFVGRKAGTRADHTTSMTNTMPTPTATVASAPVPTDPNLPTV